MNTSIVTSAILATIDVNKEMVPPRNEITHIRPPQAKQKTKLTFCRYVSGKSLNKEPTIHQLCDAVNFLFKLSVSFHYFFGLLPTIVRYPVD